MSRADPRHEPDAGAPDTPAAGADEALVEQAAAVLRGNSVGDYTRPSPRLYPHQWNWDSAFVAIGLAHLDWARAVREIESLLAAQWQNGMLPHIVYNPAVTEYAPGPEWWPDVPVRTPGVRTSGMSQPPVLPTAAYLVGLLQPDQARRLAWWNRLFEPLRDAVLYYARERTTAGSPLIVVVHPWESGADNSPRWDFVTGRGYKPSRPYRRVDTTIVDAAERPHQRDYDLYMHLVELLAQSRYDLRAYLGRTPFAVYDALFNAIWYRAALDLNRIAAAIGRPPAVPDADLLAFRDAYHGTLWSDEAALFRDVDLRAEGQIAVDTIAGLGAIYGGLVEAAQGDAMLAAYRARCPGCHLLPSVPRDEPSFEPGRYWRGPVWVHLNWMIVRGLELLGQGEAVELAASTVGLVRRAGFHENFHALTGAGLGGDQFSWSAALLIDLVRRPIGADAS